MKSHALQPTPLFINEETIRVFAGFRDRDGASRVGYVDLDARDPLGVQGWSREPLLDVGIAGAFDDNGVVPSAVVRADDEIRLYYAGYQLGRNVRFSVFGGLAISLDGGTTFSRWKCVPVMDRTEHELLFRVPHSVMWENGRWRVWYGGGSTFVPRQGKTLPIYDIRYMESPDGLSFPEKGTTVLHVRSDEYRLGRPYVLRLNQRYAMFFGASSERIPYHLCYAESADGVEWTREDQALNLIRSGSGFDSHMTAYPAVVDSRWGTYMFYNGNDYGEAGFGYAVLDGRLD